MLVPESTWRATAQHTPTRAAYKLRQARPKGGYISASLPRVANAEVLDYVYKTCIYK